MSCHLFSQLELLEAIFQQNKGGRKREPCDPPNERSHPEERQKESQGCQQGRSQNDSCVGGLENRRAGWEERVEASRRDVANER